jgi:hypothetical protein
MTRKGELSSFASLIGFVFTGLFIDAKIPFVAACPAELAFLGLGVGARKLAFGWLVGPADRSSEQRGERVAPPRRRV